MTPRTNRRLLTGLAVLLVAAVYMIGVRDGMADFEVGYRAGQRLADGETLYQTEDGHFMFKYLPFSAILYLPLTVLPLGIAKALWFGISVIALLAMIRLANQLVSGKVVSGLSTIATPLPALRVIIPALVPALILAKYFLHELRLGQINILVTLIMMLAAHRLARPGVRQQIIAGALAGLATAIKPYAALLFPYFILKRRWASAAAGLGVLVTSLAVPSVFYGVGGNVDVLRQWAQTLSESTPALLTNSDNVSVVAFFTKWMGDPARAVPVASLVLGALAVLLLVVIIRGGNRQDSPVLECAMVFTLIPLVSPMGWDYTFLMSLLAMTLLVNHFDAFPIVTRVLLAVNFAIIALALYDVMGRQAYATFMQWSVTTINFLLIVCGLAYLRFRRAC